MTFPMQHQVVWAISCLVVLPGVATFQAQPHGDVVPQPESIGEVNVSAEDETNASMPMNASSREEDVDVADHTEMSTENVSGDVVVTAPSKPAEAVKPVRVEDAARRLMLEALNSFRDRRGTAGWQAPQGSYDIDAPTPEMREVSIYGHAVKIYLTDAAMASASGVTKGCGMGSAPLTKGRRINVTAAALKRSKIWFMDPSNYTLKEYILDRAHCGHLNLVSKVQEAHLCYPSCDNADPTTGLPDPSKYAPGEAYTPFVMHVAPNGRELFDDCEHIEITFGGPETAKCKVMAPLMHGVVRPPGVMEADAPWNVRHQRDIMMSFMGGTPKNPATIDQMVEAATEQDPAKPYHDFAAPVFRTTMDTEPIRFFKAYQTMSWELIAASVFSWQPGTITRRGFYDAWMFGTIPVVTATGAASYEQLFDGLPWKTQLRKLAVVLPERVTEGSAILTHLKGVHQEAIIEHRRKIRQVAPFLQYGWSERADAFTSALGTLVRRNMNSTTTAAWAQKALDAAAGMDDKIVTGVKWAAVNKAEASSTRTTTTTTSVPTSTAATTSTTASTSASTTASTTTTAMAKDAAKSSGNASITRHVDARDKKKQTAKAHSSSGATKKKSHATSKAETNSTSASKVASSPSNTTMASNATMESNATLVTPAPQTGSVWETSVSENDLPKAEPSAAIESSEKVMELIPKDDVATFSSHSAFFLVMAIGSLFVVGAGIAVVTSPKLTETMRNPGLA